MVNDLLAHPLSSIRRKSLDILNTKLQNDLDFFSSEDRIELVAMVKPLTIMADTNLSKVDDTSGCKTEQDVHLNQQTSLFSLKLLVRLVAADNPEEMKDVINVVLRILREYRTLSNTVLASDLLCLGEIVK